MRMKWHPIVALPLAGALSLALLAGSSMGQDRGFTDKYGVIWQRNMFVRDRSRPGATTGPTSREFRAPRLEQAFALTGIIEVDPNGAGGGVFLAFIEDARAGTTIRVQVGDTIARGRISRIIRGRGGEEDSIEYESNGRAQRVTVGMNFDGGQGAVAIGVATTMPALESGGTGGAISGGGSGGAASDIEAKMRARRAKEMGQ